MTHALIVITLFHAGLWTVIGVLVRLEPPHHPMRLTLVSGGATSTDGLAGETPHDTAA